MYSQIFEHFLGFYKFVLWWRSAPKNGTDQMIELGAKVFGRKLVWWYEWAGRLEMEYICRVELNTLKSDDIPLWIKLKLNPSMKMRLSIFSMCLNSSDKNVHLMCFKLPDSRPWIAGKNIAGIVCLFPFFRFFHNQCFNEIVTFTWPPFNKCSAIFVAN